MAKEILFNIDARDQLKKGVDALDVYKRQIVDIPLITCEKYRKRSQFTFLWFLFIDRLENL